MIALVRDRKSIPKSFKTAALGASALALLDIYYANPNGPYDFKSSAWKPAKQRLKKEAHGKCAYCEAPTDVVAHGDVEHFRPKAAYWWLALCYDNYLFSCQICNQTYKGENFPIAGSLLVAPKVPIAKPAGPDLDELLKALVIDASKHNAVSLEELWGAEDADLPNPYFEDPEPLFSYEVDPINKEVWLRSSGTPRGDRAAKAAEDCLGINRDEIKRERYSSYRLLKSFKTILDLNPVPEARAIAEEEIRQMQDAAEPFAGMRRFFARSWGLPGPV